MVSLFAPLKAAGRSNPQDRGPGGNLLDSVIEYVSPGWAMRRAHARRVLAYYEAAKPTTTRKARKETGSGDTAVLRAGRSLREQARHLEQNHDLARGALSVLVANIVGPHGIAIEPQPRNTDGTINTELAAQIRKLWRDWSKRPEVTWCHDWASTQRLCARAWVRDGEFLAQKVLGNVVTLDHGTRVPFSLELLESDLLPFELISWDNPTITAGVERNAWGRPVAFHVYRRHPGDWQSVNSFRLHPGSTDLKRISADRMIHTKLVDRFRQARGVSVFASVLGRLDDIKDYEESERIAAKVAASMAAFIKKGRPEEYEQQVDPATGQTAPRNLKFAPGMIFDDLMPGEEIGTIDTSRPNTNLEKHRNGQLRAVASGVGTTYSSLSKNYDGTYSSQRQELVEGWGVYAIIQAEFCSQFVRPVYEAFLSAATAAGLLRLTRGVDPDSLDDALYIGPQMPWIDPVKEAKSWEALERNGHASGPEIIRRRGQNPTDVLEQERQWRQQWRDAELKIATDPANDKGVQPHPTDPNNAETD
jgi:lambda family phage portal protein